MRSKTKNVRRATQDLDLDFIRYSLSDESIDAFISKLNFLQRKIRKMLTYAHNFGNMNKLSRVL